MIVKGDATNLSDPLQATFIPVSQFGAGGGGGGGASSLSTLTDVELNSVTDNDVLTYSSASAAWVNKPVFPYSGSVIITGSVTASAFTGSLSYNFLTNLPTLVSSSAQVSYTGLSSIPSGIVSSSTQIPALLPNGTVSASSQVNHNITTNYVANEHIDHTTVSISAGSGLTGGGTIAATRTLTLDTGSTHFTGGVTTRVNALGVYSSSAQLVVSAYTNATDNRVITSTGAGGINAESNLTFDGDTLNVNGDLTATTKSFLINHPIKQNHKLRYGSLESPYHGIRLTGEGIVTGGKCQINLPDYIGSFVHEDGVNIQLTGVGHNKVLWVSTIDLEHNTFIVKAKTWLFDKKDYKFFWTFTAIRKDIDDLLVEYESK